VKVCYFLLLPAVLCRLTEIVLFGSFDLIFIVFIYLQRLYI
jgi:hypothetical protein